MVIIRPIMSDPKRRLSGTPNPACTGGTCLSDPVNCCNVHATETDLLTGEDQGTTNNHIRWDVFGGSTGCWKDLCFDTYNNNWMIDFLGLEWDDRCLEPHQSERGRGSRRYMPTLSIHQVRQPIGRGSLDRAAAFGDRMAALHLGLAGDS